MKTRIIAIARDLVLALTLAFALAACPSGAKDDPEPELNPVETFTDADAPESFTVDSLDFTGPWGYDKPGNESRRYPLVVSGYWGEGLGQYAAVARRFPAFTVDFQKNGEADGEALGEWIDMALAAGYRIDVNRVYLTGFSMGGSGSFPLARGMLANGKYFAAIVRVAGQSESDLGAAIAEKTAVWYHVGLEDTATRIEVARAALARNRAYPCNGTASETSVADSITGHDRVTVTLTREGREMFKYSEYEGLGHDPSPCYRDDNLFAWMFSRSLDDR